MYPCATVLPPPEEHSLLLKKIMRHEADAVEQQRFKQLQNACSVDILEMDECGGAHDQQCAVR